jgi:hypothetical protein
MTTEANNSDSRVSEAYRSSATETTTPELDATILKMAASTTPTRYGLARGWLRPLAWAATIGLSLAFILEISQYQNLTVVLDPIPEKVEQHVTLDNPAAVPEDADVVSRKLNKQTGASSPAKALSPRAENAAPAAMDSAPRRQDFAADSAGLVTETEEQVRIGASEARLTASPAEKKELIEHCDDDARSTAESWYACVEDLKDEGLTDAARKELDALLIEFPDFREPDMGR